MPGFRVVPLPDSIEEWDHQAPLPKAAVREEKGVIHLDWKKPLKEPTRVYPDNWLGGFNVTPGEFERELAGGEGKLRFLARSTFYRTSQETWGGQVGEPGEDVAESVELDWQWLGSATGEEKAGLPPEFQRMDTRFLRKDDVTFHSILLKAEDVAAIDVFGVLLFDARTSRRIGWPAVMFQTSERVGDWIRLTQSVWIQHETPVLLKLDFAAGTPKSARLPLQPNAEVVVNENLRVGHVCSRVGHLYAHDSEIALEFEPNPDVQSFTLVGPATYTDRRLLVRHPAEQTWIRSKPWVYIASNPDDMLIETGVHLVSFTGLGEELPTHLEVGYLPYKQRLWVHFDDLGGMPSPGGIENLFDVRIPFYWEGNYSGLSPIAQMLELDLGGNVSGGGYDRLPPSLTETTPREVLREFARKNPRVRIWVDEEEQELVVNERPSFLERVKGWLEKLQP